MRRHGRLNEALKVHNRSIEFFELTEPLVPHAMSPCGFEDRIAACSHALPGALQGYGGSAHDRNRLAPVVEFLARIGFIGCLRFDSPPVPCRPHSFGHLTTVGNISVEEWALAISHRQVGRKFMG